MDMEEEVRGESASLEVVALGEVTVLAASAEELAAHEDLLGGLDKAVKGSCVWRNVQAT